MPQEQYLGNPNLKKANTAFEFTATQIEEFITVSYTHLTLPTNREV